MQSEILARITHQSNEQIALQVRRKPCAGCDGRCGAFFNASSDDRLVVVAKPYIKLAPGQFDIGNQVKIGIPVNTLIGLSSLVYLAPVVLMLLSAVVCFRIYSQSDFAIAISAGFGLIGGLMAARFVLARFEKNQAAETLFIRHDPKGP